MGDSIYERKYNHRTQSSTLPSNSCLHIFYVFLPSVINQSILSMISGQKEDLQ